MCLFLATPQALTPAAHLCSRPNTTYARNQHPLSNIRITCFSKLVAVAKIRPRSNLPWAQWLTVAWIFPALGRQVCWSIFASGCSWDDLGSRLQVEFRSLYFFFHFLWTSNILKNKRWQIRCTNTLSSSTWVLCAKNSLVKASHMAKSNISGVEKYTLPTRGHCKVTQQRGLSQVMIKWNNIYKGLKTQ